MLFRTAGLVGLIALSFHSQAHAFSGSASKKKNLKAAPYYRDCKRALTRDSMKLMSDEAKSLCLQAKHEAGTNTLDWLVGQGSYRSPNLLPTRHIPAILKTETYFPRACLNVLMSTKHNIWARGRLESCLSSKKHHWTGSTP